MRLAAGIGTQGLRCVRPSNFRGVARRGLNLFMGVGGREGGVPGRAFGTGQGDKGKGFQSDDLKNGRGKGIPKHFEEDFDPYAPDDEDFDFDLDDIDFEDMDSSPKMSVSKEESGEEGGVSEEEARKIMIKEYRENPRFKDAPEEFLEWQYEQDMEAIQRMDMAMRGEPDRTAPSTTESGKSKLRGLERALKGLKRGDGGTTSLDGMSRYDIPVRVSGVNNNALKDIPPVQITTDGLSEEEIEEIHTQHDIAHNPHSLHRIGSPDPELAWKPLPSDGNYEREGNSEVPPVKKVFPHELAPPRFKNRREAEPLPAHEMRHTNLPFLRRFVSDSGAILSRKYTGISAKDQRKVAKMIKRARQIGLIPHVGGWEVMERRYPQDLAP